MSSQEVFKDSFGRGYSKTLELGQEYKLTGAFRSGEQGTFRIDSARAFYFGILDEERVFFAEEFGSKKRTIRFSSPLNVTACRGTNPNHPQSVQSEFTRTEVIDPAENREILRRLDAYKQRALERVAA